MKNPLPNLSKKLSRVYGFNVRLVGPYTMKKGRKLVDVRALDKKDKCHLCKTIQLARARLEIKIGRPLCKGETVDHIDEDCTNDTYGNLQLLSLSANSSKGSKDQRRNAANATRTVQARKANSERNKGELNSQATLSDKDVRILRKKFAKHRNFDRLVEESGIGRKSVINFLCGRTYVDAGGPLFVQLPRKRGRGAGSLPILFKRVKRERG